MNFLDRKAKIKWNCRRGMLELDLILERFFIAYIDKLDQAQLTAFEQLLTSPDPSLYAWLMGQDIPIAQELTDIVTFIKFHDNI